MSILSIILFFTYTYGLGYSLSRFLNKNTFETFVIRIAIGLATIPVLGLLLNLLHVPIDWKIFLILSLILPVYDFIKNIKTFSLKPTMRLRHIKSYTWLLLAIFILALWIYCKGPFEYSWMEDEDPWFHAAGVKYVALEKTVNAPKGMFQYINPYPPGYDLLLGILHQTSASLSWTIKFFNSFFICLGFLFFYFFANELTKDQEKSLVATFLLLCAPCYLSHFIWAHALIVTLFFPAFYLILKAKEDRRYGVAASIINTSIFVIQPTQPIKFMVLSGLLIVALLIVERKLPMRVVGIFISAIALAMLVWWGPIIGGWLGGKAVLSTHHNLEASGLKTQELTGVQSVTKTLAEFFSPQSGSATAKYPWQYFVQTVVPNRINNPVGVGRFLAVLYLLGIGRAVFILRRQDSTQKIYLLTILFWFLFTFLGVNSMTFNLPVGLFAFRFWMLFAIPISFLAAEAIDFIKKKSMNKRILVLAILLFVSGESLKSTMYVNSGSWPTSEAFWTSLNELDGYQWLRTNLKVDTRVYAFSNNHFVLSYDMRSDYWSKEYQASLKDGFNQDIGNLHDSLKQNNYEYVIIGARERNLFGEKTFDHKVMMLLGSGLYKLVHRQGNDAWIFKVL